MGEPLSEKGLSHKMQHIDTDWPMKLTDMPISVVTTLIQVEMFINIPAF